MHVNTKIHILPDAYEYRAQNINRFIQIRLGLHKCLHNMKLRLMRNCMYSYCERVKSTEDRVESFYSGV